MNDKLNWNTRYVKGVGEKRARQLEKLGLHTVEDLLYHIPRRYIDYSEPLRLAYAPFGEVCAVKATVLEKGRGVRIRSGRKLFKVTASDDTALLDITFFNSEYTVNQLEVGREYIFYGKLEGSLTRRKMTTPLFIPADAPIKRKPVYPLTAGISTNQMAAIIANAFALAGHLDDPLPEGVREKYSLADLDSALRWVHFPDSDSQLAEGIKRISFEELFYLQLGLAAINSSQRRKNLVSFTDADISPFLRSLPYAPTGAQNRAVSEILTDFMGSYSMNRLLQGDVGSGKTMVAMAAMYAMYINGHQSCIMAPTEILAVQHYETIGKGLGKLGVRVGLLTASVKGKQRKDVLRQLEEGEIDVLVGTHAILSERVVFSDLAFCVTDEQHRFGVVQRSLISKKGENPHILIMSATPIPRTLAMIIYAGMGISVLDEMPAGRLPVKTYLVDTSYRKRMFSFVEENRKKGYQTYIVLPAIDENEEMEDLQALTVYCDEVVRPLLPDARVGMLHGRMKSSEKEAVMERFVRGDIDVLCSTTVIEVGVDVPNAVLMIIENAERYGLSAMHQLRGRVGRSDVQSWCILVSDSKSKNVQDRLKFLAANNDGFAVSRYDLENRGPGDFFGSAQHGLPVMKTARMLTDMEMLKASREAAEEIMKDSPDLEKYPRIRDKCRSMLREMTL